MWRKHEVECTRPSGERLPVPWKEVGASLALGAAVLAFKAGLRLMRQLLGRKAIGLKKPPEQHTLLRGVARWLPRRGEELHQTQPRVRIWGRRVWGIWRSDGASRWEFEEVFWEGTTK